MNISSEQSAIGGQSEAENCRFKVAGLPNL